MTGPGPDPDSQALVPGRACGTCNVCCVALTIDDPALQKPEGYRCRNTLADKSCGIYATRPAMCRGFYCGWMRLKWIRDPLRPDISGVLVRLQYDGTPASGGATLGVEFSLLTEAAIKADGLAETVAAAIAAGIPTYLYVPGPPGHTGGRTKLNAALEDAVLTRDKPAVLAILKQARALGRRGRSERISFGGGR